MKNLIFFFSTLFSILFFSFPVHAQFMPPTLPSSGADSAVNGMTQLMLKEMVNSLGIDMPDSDYKNAWLLMTGSTYDESFNYTYIPASNLSGSISNNLYDSSGSLVSFDDATIAFGTNSQGMTTTYIYSNITGDILNIGESFELSESSLNGHINEPYLNFCQEIASPMRNHGQTAIYKPAELSPELKTYVESQPFSLYAMSRDRSFCVVVPNACSPDCTVMYANGTYSMSWNDFRPNQARSMPTILANDDSFVYWLGNSNLQGFSTGTYYYYSHVFTKRSWIHNIQNPLWDGGCLYYHIPTQQEFNSVVNGIGSEMEQKIIYATIIEPFNVPDTMSYDKLRTQNITKNITINNDYDYSQPMTVNNYPVNIIYPEPDLIPTTNVYETVYNYINSPNANTSVGTLNPSDITDNIPILSNLKNRFPFSIPFDLYEMAKAFNVPREVPVLDFSFFIYVINYEANIHFDLTPWDDMFSLFRTLELILFIGALAIFSYDHFFGT